MLALEFKMLRDDSGAAWLRKVDVRLPGKGISNSHGGVQAHEQEKKLEDKTGMFIDRTYHLYAIVRRGNEEVQIVVSFVPQVVGLCPAPVQPKDLKS